MAAGDLSPLAPTAARMRSFSASPSSRRGSARNRSSGSPSDSRKWRMRPSSWPPTTDESTLITPASPPKSTPLQSPRSTGSDRSWSLENPPPDASSTVSLSSGYSTSSSDLYKYVEPLPRMERKKRRITKWHYNKARRNAKFSPAELYARELLKKSCNHECSWITGQVGKLAISGHDSKGREAGLNYSTKSMPGPGSKFWKVTGKANKKFKRVMALGRYEAQVLCEHE